MLDRHAENVWYSCGQTGPKSALLKETGTPMTAVIFSAKRSERKNCVICRTWDSNVYLYFRQFLAENGTYENRAPYKKWLGRDENGHRRHSLTSQCPTPDVLGGEKQVRWDSG